MMAAGVRIQNGQSKIRNRLDSETSCGEALTGLLFFAFAPDGRGILACSPVAKSFWREHEARLPSAHASLALRIGWLKESPLGL